MSYQQPPPLLPPQPQPQLPQLPQQVSNWLYNVIQPSYKYKQIVYSQVYQFLQLHLKRNLNFKIRTQVHTSEDTGESNLLINLFGNIFINNEISVPIEIWIPLDYPNESCPLVYIIPNHSKNWFLKPNNYVDAQGKFYHPYLSNWFGQCMEGNVDLLHFHLNELINIIYQSVKLEVPIQNSVSVIPSRVSSVPTSNNITPQTTGPPLPAKPPKLLSPQNTTPLKYQNPLPLPQEQVQVQAPYPMRNSPTPSLQPNLQSPQHTQAYPQHQAFQQHQPHPTGPAPAPAEIPTRPPATIDLVDNINQLSIEDPIRKHSLQILSNQFNEIFTNDSIHQQIKYINENVAKSDALFNQLNHHYQQAEQNSNILQDHINHLSTQLNSSTNLNQELNKLNQLNNQSNNKIHINSNSGILLDDLIIPDSPLVKQLYEIVSDIKAIKDTINLISGNFLDNNEFINDKNSDNCIKIMRNLGRELFWLELIKNEIVNTMNLK
ncbi:STP22 [Candida jiufengensis]|uniref:STP22 n=1 Tax=Candida jiufengensis TaxID=497108 RepID=UPI002224CFC2|nr:STP22 [Candida jiufengensis]KAI5951828.1 STP22 [Candida jiufengensis]